MRAGLTSSSVEMAARGATGLVLDLDRVPLREERMTPYEILLSESQERMLLVARQGSEEAVQAIFRRWDLEAVVVGRVTDDGVYRARWHGEDVVALPVSLIGDNTPVYRRPAAEPAALPRELQDPLLPGRQALDRGGAWGAAAAPAGSTRCARSTVVPARMSIVRSTTFRSSRTLPGHG